jgi:hypothetical protein
MLSKRCKYLPLSFEWFCHLRVSCNTFTMGNSGNCDIKVICMCKGFNYLSVSLLLDMEMQSVTLLHRMPSWQRALYDSRADRTENTRHHYLSNWIRAKLMSLFSLCSSFSKCFVLFFCYWMDEGYLGRYLEEILGLSYNSISEHTPLAFVCEKCMSIGELPW